MQPQPTKAPEALDLHSFSVSAIRALNMSVAIARRFGARALSSEHLLLALVNQSDGNANKILLHFGVDLFDLRAAIEEFLALPNTHLVPLSDYAFDADGGQRVTLSPNLALVLDRARLAADEYRLAWVGTDHLLAALVGVDTTARAILKRFGVTQGRVDEALRQITGGGEAGRNAAGDANTEIVVDLVRAAGDPRWQTVVERAAPTRELVNILLQRRRNSAIVVGEPGSGRRSVIAGLAQLAARGQSPEGLGGQIWALGPAALGGNPEPNIELALRVAHGGILLVPDIALFFGGSAFPGYAEAGMLLRTALTDRRLRLIGTATPQGFNKYLDGDPALAERAAPLRLEPPTVAETGPILDTHRAAFERDYRVTFAPEATATAAALAKQYLPGALPATALAALERACVLTQLAGAAAPELRPVGVKANGAGPTVDASVIAAAVGAMSGVPVGQMVGPERERLARMEEELHRRVIGQDEAIAAISRAYRRARAGFRDVKRPIGSFLFLGPSGVGKTETARALAEFLFGTEEALIRIDMSEYGEKHTVARLVGSPPGYVGYEEGGQLTEQVRRKPSSVVLFDEVEKAHPDVYNLFLQVLDDGWLTDGKGRRVDFRNTMIIMTSNLGTEYILGEGTDQAGAELGPETRDRIDEVLRGHFRPEFLNRLDKTIIFTPLSREQLGKVLDLQLARVDQMARGAGLGVAVAPAAQDWLLGQNHQPEFGARPIRRIVQDFVQDPLVDGLTDGRFGPGDTIRVDVAGEGPLTFTKVEGQAPAPPPAPVAEAPAAERPPSPPGLAGGDAEAEPPAATEAVKRADGG